MAPIPPDKDADQSEEFFLNDSFDSSEAHREAASTITANETSGLNSLNVDQSYHLISENTPNHFYRNEDDDEDDDESDDDEEEESDEEIDDDLHFQLLASSRSTQTPRNVKYTEDVKLEYDDLNKKERIACENIELDEIKSMTIVNLMANFQLPDHSVPFWSKIIPEEVWKQNLLNSLNEKKMDLFPSNSNSSPFTNNS